MVKLQKIIFKETTTIGIRYRQESRTELQKENIEIDTKYGKMKAKKVTNNGEEYIYPEYESLKNISNEKNPYCFGPFRGCHVRRGGRNAVVAAA